MGLPLYDAHNHLQDERLAPHRAALLEACSSIGLARCVVNGTAEADWPAVLELARQHPQVLPSFGLHPWYVKDGSPEWKSNFIHFLDQTPSAIGEIGLDRWIEDYDLPRQEEAFTFQMQVAAERNLPASIHCLRAWGRLFDLLRAGPRPSCGFLLHSYGGPLELVEPLAELGAYFSISGHFAHARKARQRETFRQVPRERLLIETDAPDMLPPEPWVRYAMGDPPTGQPLNHPANLVAVYEFVAQLLDESRENLTRQVEENFRRLFGAVK
jgi:TatD DNase family protein